MKNSYDGTDLKKTKQKTIHYVVWPELFISVSCLTRVQMVVFFCSIIPMGLFDNPGTQLQMSQHFFLCPQFCFIIGFICELFVAHHDS